MEVKRKQWLVLTVIEIVVVVIVILVIWGGKMRIAEGCMIVSSFSAALGLVYTALKIRESSKINQKKMYMNSVDRYYTLRKMIIEDIELDEIYKKNIPGEYLSAKQEYYILSLIVFCEELFLTDSIDIFKNIKGGNWRNFIRRTFSCETIQNVWKHETVEPKKSDFSEEFITFINKL